MLLCNLTKLEAAAELVDKAADAVECVVKDGVRRAMNQFNRRVTGTL